MQLVTVFPWELQELMCYSGHSNVQFRNSWHHPNDPNYTRVQLLRVQNCTCAIGFISLCKSKSSTESKSWATSLSLQVKKFDRFAVDVGQHHSHNLIYCFHPTVMIVNQDTDLLHALQSTCDAGGALETLHQLNHDATHSCSCRTCTNRLEDCPR